MAVLGVTLAAAAPASAASGLIEVGTGELDGPVLTGDHVVWVRGAGPGEVDLHVSRLDGSDRRSVRVPVEDVAPGPPGASTVTTLALAASERRWALATSTTRCVGETSCRYQFSRLIRSSLMTAPLGEPPQVVTDCDGLEECSPCSDASPSVDVSADAVAYSDPCRRASTVRDFAAGAPAERTFEGVTWIRIAGPFAALGTDGIQVHDWRSGERVFGVPPDKYAREFDIQEDGTLAFTRSTAREFESELAWASIAEPFPHSVGVAVSPSISGIAKNRIAFWRQHSNDPSAHLGVVALDGTRPALLRPSAEFRSPVFDGDRLAYVQSPCGLTAIAVWDIAGPPPELPRAQCPAVRLASRSARADLSARRLSVELSCPATPRLGCHALSSVTARHRRLRRPKSMSYGYGLVDFAPGETKTVNLRLARRLACKFERTGDVVKATIEIDSWGRDEIGHNRARHPLRVRGLAACDG